ncbi:ribonuclease Oy-like protein, partial [Leptotrombidium deliense]
KQSQKRKYDHLTLAIQWTPGLCYASKKCTKYKDEFTIHGMWPSNVKKDDKIEFCCDEKLKYGLLKPLLNDLSTYWPGLHMPDKAFWTHEWKKHGTCASYTSHLNGQQKYFSTSLKLFKNLRLHKIFADAKIVPGKLGNGSEYKLDYVREVIKKKIGKNVRFACRIKDSISKIPFLKEIYICYDAKSLQPIDCPDYDKCRGSTAHFLKSH